MAAVIAVLGGRRGRRAALEGVLAIGVTSATVNLGMKPLAQRRRPDRAGAGTVGARQIAMPESASSRPVMLRRRSRSPTRSAGTCRGWPCRSGCWRVVSPTRESTQACIIRATW